jgi:hypothetical protein
LITRLGRFIGASDQQNTAKKRRAGNSRLIRPPPVPAPPIVQAVFGRQKTTLPPEGKRTARMFSLAITQHEASVQINPNRPEADKTMITVADSRASVF